MYVPTQTQEESIFVQNFASFVAVYGFFYEVLDMETSYTKTH